jgi:glycerol uptake facilitator-like aquaporin
MEFKNGGEFILANIAAEFWGTLGYMLAFNITTSIDQIPLVLYSMVILTMKVSGGHLNPAITFAVYLEKKKYRDNVIYAVVIIIAQISGALLALIFGVFLRTSIPQENGKYYFVPS